MVIEGCLIGESLRAGSVIESAGLRIRRIVRMQVADPAPTQPPVWTVIDFAADDADPGQLAAVLAECLRPDGGWYADFTAGAEHYIVFGGRSFHYRRGDEQARAAAAAYGRTVGVPEHQLDWRD